MNNMNNTAAMIDVLRDLVVTDGAFVNAKDALHSAVKRASEAGIKSGDLDGKPKGKWFVETQTVIAQERFTPEELALWNDPAVKQKVGNDKHKLATRINSVMKRIRDHLALSEAASVTDPKEGAVAGKPRGKAASFADLCAKDLQAAYTRANKDRVGDEPATIDYAAFISHLNAAADVLGKKLKDK